MTIAGWITLILSVGGVTLLFAWCIVRVLRKHTPDHELAHVEPVEEDQTDQR
jgi:hypothetical protein